MSTKVEQLDGLEVKISFQIAANELNAPIQKRVAEFAKTANIKGFRPGKVPTSVIEQRFGDGIKHEELGKLQQTALFNAIDENKLRVAGIKKIEEGIQSDTENLSFNAIVEVYPEIKIDKLDSLQIEKQSAEVQDSDVEDMINRLRDQRKEWVEVERAAQQGDTVTIDFIGKIDGEAFEGGTAEDYRLELGTGRMIPGFEEGVVGATPNSTVDITTEFPKDYHHKDFAGKEAIFSVTVKTVQAPKLPEIDEEFFKAFGGEVSDIDSFKQVVKKNMQRELARNLQDKLNSQLMEKLLEQHEFEVPQSLIESDLQRMQKQYDEYVKNYKNAPAFQPEEHRDEAKKRVALGLLFGELVKKFDIQVDKDRVKETIEKMAENYDQPEEVVRWYYSHKDHLVEVEARVLEEQVVEKVLEQAKVTQVEASYIEVIGQNPAEEVA